MSNSAISDAAIAQLFTDAHTHNGWQDRAIDNATLHQLYEVAKWAPTSMNISPARFVFVIGAEGKARLKPALAAGNVDKTMAAPLTVIVATDPKFYEQLPVLFPAYPNAREMYSKQPEWAAETGFRNSSMQGAYLILAARALGLDCGPMSGFDNAKVDAEFFSQNGYRSNFLINIGYGSVGSTNPRGPRLAFEQAIQIV
ncbi:MAG TPA: malonic semialdehyde reductase [Spongiibacteraceae bacterium]|jgi:3-hydroxypropanoate dehydrogenase